MMRAIRDSGMAVRVSKLNACAAISRDAALACTTRRPLEQSKAARVGVRRRRGMTGLDVVLRAHAALSD